jgi:hypothetical protein
MAAWRRAIELSLGDADAEKLRLIAQSRTEPASRVERAWRPSLAEALMQLHNKDVIFAANVPSYEVAKFKDPTSRVWKTI